MVRTALTVAPTSLPCSSARLRLRSCAPPADQLQRQHVRKRHADADRGERQIVDRHGGGEEDDRGQVERIGGDAARKQAADLLVGADAAGNVAGVTLGEELDRQRHHMPEKAADHDDRKLGLQPQQQRLAHERQEPRAPAAVRAMPISSGTSQLAVCWIRMSSTKILENPAATIAGHDQREADDHQQADGGLRGAQFAQQQPQALRLAAGPLERRGRLHREHDAGEREIEFDHVGPPAADRRDR